MSAAIASHNQQSKDGDQPMEADATVDDDLDDDFNYEDIGEFLLIGGLNDPFSAQYRAPFRDGNGSEHKTVERYVWYKMAETFEDKDAMAKILNAEMSSAAEEAARNLKVRKGDLFCLRPLKTLIDFRISTKRLGTLSKCAIGKTVNV